MPSGAQISYAEIDGDPVCITNDRWCERSMGHDGPHVFAPERQRGPISDDLSSQAGALIGVETDTGEKDPRDGH